MAQSLLAKIPMVPDGPVSMQLDLAVDTMTEIGFRWYGSVDPTA